MSQATVRDWVLPTTATRAHIPKWMIYSSYMPHAEAPVCSFAGDHWTRKAGGLGRPLCHWCVRALAEHAERAWRMWESAAVEKLRAALGGDT